jgi:hypothetical protein
MSQNYIDIVHGKAKCEDGVVLNLKCSILKNMKCLNYVILKKKFRLLIRWIQNAVHMRILKN